MIAFFCGGFYLPEDMNGFMRNSKVALSWANDRLQWGFIKGFKEYYTHLECISVPQIGAYPFRYSKLKYVGNDDVKKEFFHAVSFCNLIFYKHLSQYRQLKKILHRKLDCISVSEEVVIYVYDLNLAIIKAVAELKEGRSGIKLCLIIPDLSAYTGEGSFLHQKFLAWQESRLVHLYEKVDFFVLISKHMKEKIPCIGNRYITIEGIYNPVYGDNNLYIGNQAGIRSVFYSGAVSIRNGIVNLLEAFKQIPDERYRLYVCGTGDAVETVMRYSELDSRVIYKGQLLPQDITSLQQQATLLINPRTPEQVFSRYSFPSKTMEYFASGVPVLMYKLDGVPEEYYQYCFCPDNFSIEALRDKVIEVCDMDENELRNVGQSAKNFVEKMKNPIVQCGKIYDFIQKFKL